MKIGRRVKESQARINKPVQNKIKRDMLLIVIIAVTAVLIFVVYSLGKKAEQTVRVAMMARDVYKNEVITESMFKPYDMVQSEYEKYAVVKSDGTSARRVLLWDEIGVVINGFAAYPLQSGTYAEYRNFIKTRIDNSDNVLYSFPGKEIVPLEINATELRAFKTFLQPGDSLNIEAIYSQDEVVKTEDEYGGISSEKISIFKSETVFRDIMIADLLNKEGKSILDIYASYNEATVYEQAQMDKSAAFQESTEPTVLLVALTPEEKTRYYYYLSKKDVTFKISMPQRIG